LLIKQVNWEVLVMGKLVLIKGINGCNYLSAALEFTAVKGGY